MTLPSDVNEGINQALEVAPELSATTGGIRDKEDGACAECIPSSPGKEVTPQGVAGVGGTSATEVMWRGAARPERVLYEMPVIQEMSQSTPGERSDLQSESKQRFGGKQESVNVGGLTKTPLQSAADSQIYQVTSSEPSTALAGNPGVSTSARVDAPEEITNKLAGERAETTRDPHESREYVSAHEEQRASISAALDTESPIAPASGMADVCDARTVTLQTEPLQKRSDRCVIGSADETAMTSPAIPLESLAKYSDEGENGWNAWGRADIARKMNRIAAGGYNSVENLISKVEELAEVGQ